MSGRSLGARLALAAALAGAAGALGCGVAGSVQPVRSQQAAQSPPIYLNSVPARAYRERGLVQAYGTGKKASEAAMFDALRARGKGMGCDALAEVNVDVGDTKAHAIGVCVEWAESAPNVPPGGKP